MTGNPIQILLVEDNTADAVLLKTELAESPFGPFSITHVKRLAEALRCLQQQRFDAVLADLGLPDSQGLATLERLHKEKPREIPIVVLTGLDDEVLGLRALTAGADDYLVKGGSAGNMLARAVRYAIERKRANEAFLASEQRLALAVDAAKMGIFDQNIQTGKITRSHQVARIFGIRPDEFDGTYEAFEQRVHPDDRAAISENVTRLVATGEEFCHEYRILWPDGSEHWIESRAKIFCDDQGQPLRMLGTVVDISQRKAAEESARIRDAELAHLSRVTTMGQMASGLSHELNQPLAAILTYASVCLQQVESAKGSPQTIVSALNELMNETRRAGAIISRLRSFVRKQAPNNTLLDINEVVAESLRIMEFELRHQGIRPNVKFAQNLRPVLSDVIQIEQVLVNLIYNALEALGESKTPRKELGVQTHLHEDGRHVEVCVIDTGPGVPAEHLARLFEPFFTTKSTGMGMGLNISRSIIESHGGRLHAVPNPAGGMRFSFTLPVSEGAAS